MRVTTLRRNNGSTRIDLGFVRKIQVIITEHSESATVTDIFWILSSDSSAFLCQTARAYRFYPLASLELKALHRNEKRSGEESGV
jgi:hypothetical protein